MYELDKNGVADIVALILSFPMVYNMSICEMFLRNELRTNVGLHVGLCRPGRRRPGLGLSGFLKGNGMRSGNKTHDAIVWPLG